MAFVREKTVLVSKYGAGMNFLVKCLLDLPENEYTYAHGEYSCFHIIKTRRLGIDHPTAVLEQINEHTKTARLVNIYFADEDRYFYGVLTDKLYSIKRFLSLSSKHPDFVKLVDNHNKLSPDSELTLESLKIQPFQYELGIEDNPTGQTISNDPRVIANIRWYNIFIDETKREETLKELCNVLGLRYRESMIAEVDAYWKNNISLCKQFNIFEYVEDKMKRDNIKLSL